MKYSSIKLLFFCLLVGTLSLTVFPQAPAKARPTPKKSVQPTPSPTPTENENEVFEKARNVADLTERTAALKDFLEKFPGSAHTVRVQELIVSARAQDGEARMQAGDVAGGIALFELAVREAPSPLSDQLYHGVVSLIPINLSYRGEGQAAIKIANLVEDKTGSNATQLLELAKFYLSVEDAVDARRAAEKVIGADPNSAIAYEILGQAHRLNLQLDEAEAAYEKGLRTGIRLVPSILYLADAKRALGKPDEAITLYKEALEKQPDNALARSGMVIALFDAGKRPDAENELQNTLTAQPKNFALMAGVAYWYAAHNEADKAVDLAGRAITIEPRFVWAQIALARGLLMQKRPLEAERVMLQASQYGNFPTISYERANAKYAVGFFEEAAADLRRSFTIKDGKLEVNLAGRVSQSSDSFIDLLARERLASIYESSPADSPQNAAKLKNLLAFDLKTSDPQASEADIVAAAQGFVGEKDPMQSYRQLYVANKLLQKKLLPAQALEFAQSAVTGIESSVSLPNATSAVLADELLEPRASALTQGTTVDVPAVPRPVLLSIMRGRVEEVSGWALFQQQKPDEALIRLRRAVSVLPEKSAWWRSSLWKMATVLDATGKPDDAFEAYSKSFINGPYDAIRYATLQGLCQRLYGSLEGCEKKIVAAAKGEAGLKTGAGSLLKTAPAPEPTAKPADSGSVDNKAEPVASPSVEPAIPSPTPAPEITPTPQPAGQVTEPQKTPEDISKPTTLPVSITEPAAKPDGEGRKRTVTPKAANKESDDKGNVVYSNSAAQVRIGGSSENSGCQIDVNPQKLILIANGGWGSITIDLKGDGKLEAIKVSAENTEDLALELQAGIGKDIGRVMYVVRSKSGKKGESKIFVESSCGEKKEILVTVR
jgi:tetratricopeptide (TPR) repeat protein